MERFLGSGEPCPGGQEKGGRCRPDRQGVSASEWQRCDKHRAAELAKGIGRPWDAEPGSSALDRGGNHPTREKQKTKTCIGGQRLRLPVSFVRGNGWENVWGHVFRDNPGSISLQSKVSTDANAAVGALLPPRPGARPVLLQASGPPGRDAGCGPGSRWRPPAPDPVAAAPRPTGLR